MKNKNVAIIGAGIGGLSLACLLGKKGFNVNIFEKNEQVGGRCSIFEKNGFVFDMGPSWYLMPDVFEQFYQLLGEDINNHLDLKRLNPSYRVFFKDEDIKIDISSNIEENFPVFERLENGSSKKIQKYLEKSKEHYEIAMKNFIFKNYDSIFDFFSLRLILEGLRLNIFSNMQSYVQKYIKEPKIQKLLQYQLVFLGNSPYNAPAFYNLMSHIDFDMGVFYPYGGLYKIPLSLSKIAEKHGVKIYLNSPVKKIITLSGKVKGIELENGEKYNFDIVISNADLHHTETKLLEEHDRIYDEQFWAKKVMAPSGLILYLGIEEKIENALHHNLIFSKDWKKNFSQIFTNPSLPSDPSFYICAPSKTDDTVALRGKENIFVFAPIASGLNCRELDLEELADKILETMQNEMKIPNFKNKISFKRIFSLKDFAERYNSYKGTALGLAHTLFQTAVFRPKNYSSKVKGLFYTGANTIPGIGVPMCLISAELVYKRILGLKTPSHLENL